MALSLILNSTFLNAEVKKNYTPSDYSNHAKEAWNYFHSLLPQNLQAHLRNKFSNSYLTVCKGSYVSKGKADEYVVGFVDGKKNQGYSRVFLIDKKTKTISSVPIASYSNVSSYISEYTPPAIEVYCSKGHVSSKPNEDGLPAYVYNNETKKFERNEQLSEYPP